MKAEESRYIERFKKMPIPRFIVEMGENDVPVVVEANDLALEYFDLSADQVIGQKIQDFMSHENAVHFQQSFEVCIARKRPVTIQTLPGVPGKIRLYGFYITPIYEDEEKETFSYLDIVGQVEVTDQSILQRERDDAISLLTSIFEVSEVGILVTDHQAKIVRVNENFIRTYGWSRDELLNADLTSIVTLDERESVQENHEEYIRTGLRSTGEMKLIRKDGGIANVLFTTATLELSQKRRFQVTTVMDITLRKQMEESLRQAKDQADAANRAKSTFLANMSHELRTPLNAIIGFSEIMMKGTFGPLENERYVEYMGDVHESAQHLLEIINEVLDMSKIEAGRIELDEGELDVQDLIRSVIRMMDSRAFANSIILEEASAETLPPLYADQRLVRQVLINLVANAVKFCRTEGHVRIGGRMLKNGEMELTIQDEGQGIPEEKIQQAMEPFGQVSERAENSDHQGTGLGLPLAKAMVELHDGHLRLESEVGKGTTVFVHFPAYRVLNAQS